MNSIKQYRPAFFDGFENKTVEFSTTEELLEIPFVKNFNHSDFSGYAISNDLLMATYKNGKEWWVVGAVKHPSSIDLPKWEKGKPGAVTVLHGEKDAS